MKLKSFSKVAAVSAFALVTALHATDVFSAAYVIGTDKPVTFNATVVNTIDVAVTPGDFGNLAVMNSSTLGDVATATLAPSATPTITDDHSTGYGTATQAHIVGDDTSTPVAALVDVSNAFTDEDMYVTFTTCADLTAGAGPVLKLTQITTSIDATVYDCTTPMTTGAHLTLTGTTGQFYVGASISTDRSTNVAYPDGVYTGSVQMQITY